MSDQHTCLATGDESTRQAENVMGPVHTTRYLAEEDAGACASVGCTHGRTVATDGKLIDDDDAQLSSLRLAAPAGRQMMEGSPAR